MQVGRVTAVSLSHGADLIAAPHNIAAAYVSFLETRILAPHGLAPGQPVLNQDDLAPVGEGARRDRSPMGHGIHRIAQAYSGRIDRARPADPIFAGVPKLMLFVVGWLDQTADHIVVARIRLADWKVEAIRQQRPGVLDRKGDQAAPGRLVQAPQGICHFGNHVEVGNAWLIDPVLGTAQDVKRYAQNVGLRLTWRNQSR
jgi:hypothetical protein